MAVATRYTSVMTFARLMLFFPIVVALHNADEIRGYDEFAAAFHPRLNPRLRSRRIFVVAAWVITAAAALLAFANYAYSIPALQFVARSAVGALLINALGHCAISVVKHRLVPGTATALVIVFPYSALALLGTHSDLAANAYPLLGYAALAALMLPVATIASLLIGYAIVSVYNRR